MKKIAIIYLLLILMPLLLWGQKNTDTVSFRKHNFSFEFGGHYNYIYGPLYIPPRKGGTINTNPIYVGYTKKPAFAVHFGLSYIYKFNNGICLKSGLLYFNRKYITESNIDSVKKYKPYPTIPYPIKNNSSSNSIEIPFYIGYSIKKLSLFIGTKINLINFQHIHKINDNYTEKNYNKTYFSLGKGCVGDIFYFSSRLQYCLFKEKKFPISIYFATDSGYHLSEDFQIGLQININNLLWDKKLMWFTK